MLSIELTSSSHVHIRTSEGEGMNESIQVRPAPPIYVLSYSLPSTAAPLALSIVRDDYPMGL